jgi:hypothetical protein
MVQKQKNRTGHKIRIGTIWQAGEQDMAFGFTTKINQSARKTLAVFYHLYF